MDNQSVTNIKTYPLSQRPRERMIEYGEKALANYELLAILLRTGTRGSSVMEVAMSLLNQVEDLFYLKYISIEELMGITGIGKTKAIELKAAIELGFRIATATQIKSGQITSSEQIGNLLISEMKGLQQEHVIAIYLNTKNEIIKKETVFVGSLTQSVAHPREIFKQGMRYSAARIILVHNHPSGNPEPSQADIQFTTRLIECGELMGIEILDHIVIGESSYYSLKEHNYF
ncbi:RadC family protein [Lacticigenium naphthae]|uniref:RadC family protein n=1 Tax=Lacticigenium naphthae TaxID=515351 RepID=UPI000415CB84|nr:DNA repair protein RadC [Lacticigenium naphthae]